MTDTKPSLRCDVDTQSPKELAVALEERSQFKRDCLDAGVPIEHLSGRVLNLAVGLPADMDPPASVFGL